MATRLIGNVRTIFMSAIRPLPKQQLPNQHKFYQLYSTASCLNLNQTQGRLMIKWNNSEKVDEFPLVWLRDNCQCTKCFDSAARSRTIDFGTFSLHSKPLKVEIVQKGIQIVWDDNHQSIYDLEWLKLRSFSVENQQKWLNYNQATYKTWSSASFKSIEQFKFSDVISYDETLLKWLQVLEVFGVCLLEDVPHKLNQVTTLADRIAFIRKTHYGEEFSVQAKADATNVAYTSGYLQLHTDLPYYEYKPGINLLHCLVQYEGEGGDSLLSDGFRIAELLRIKEPKIYKILSETEVAWTDVARENGRDFHKIHKAPVICESRSGVIYRINYSQPQRDSHLPIPVEQVEEWYAALKRFYDLALDHENLFQFKLKPGQMITFNNLRVLHGRREFEIGVQGSRHVQGAYVDWDEARSRIRVLKAKLNPNGHLNK